MTSRFDPAPFPTQVTSMSLVVNARVSVAPDELATRLHQALAAPGVERTFESLSSFAPARPVPVHRYQLRCDPNADASCCAAFYDRPDVRYLLGDSFHPGGPKLTLTMVDGLGLKRGSRLLDVACGRGTSLAAVGEKYDIEGVGIDVAEPLPRNTERMRFVVGNAHSIPFESKSFDALLCECALSTFPDQARALTEMRRVLRPGGHLALSDMVANGPVPEALKDWVHLGTCLSHARTLSDYRALLEDSGFAVEHADDKKEALLELISRIKRKLLGAALAKASGALPADVEIDVGLGRKLLKEAESAVRAGIISYGTVIASR